MQIVFEVMNKCLENNVELITLKENYHLNNSPMSKFILSVYSYAAETERLLISERTKEGLAARKRAGVKLGRPKGTIAKELKLDKYREAIVKDLSDGIPKIRVARKYGVNVSTIYDWLKRNDIVI
jgi:DNA invertase Pin-like site-specific DNA recombinase